MPDLTPPESRFRMTLTLRPDMVKAYYSQPHRPRSTKPITWKGLGSVTNLLVEGEFVVFDFWPTSPDGERLVQETQAGTARFHIAILADGSLTVGVGWAEE